VSRWGLRRSREGGASGGLVPSGFPGSMREVWVLGSGRLVLLVGWWYGVGATGVRCELHGNPSVRIRVLHFSTRSSRSLGPKGTKELGLFLVWWGIVSLHFFISCISERISIDLPIILQFANFKPTFLVICHVLFGSCWIALSPLQWCGNRVIVMPVCSVILELQKSKC
jgi:hypothetical protein